MKPGVMSETLIKKLAERASNHPVHGDLMLAAARTIRSLEEQVRDKDRQIDDWERAAQRWVTQIRVAGPVAMSRENTPTRRLKRWMYRSLGLRSTKDVVQGLSQRG
jgi:hypothetical protein